VPRSRLLKVLNPFYTGRITITEEDTQFTLPRGLVQ